MDDAHLEEEYTEPMEMNPPIIASSEEDSQDAEADQPGPSNAVVSGMSESARKRHKKHKKKEKKLKHGFESSDEEVVDFDEQQKRRHTVFQLTRQLGDTVQKLKRGVEPGMTLDDVISKIEGIDASPIASGKEFAEDGQMILKAAEVAASGSAELRASNHMRLNTELFGLRVKAYANKLDPTADPFVVIGQTFKHLLREAPPFDFMRPCLPEHRESVFQVKTERAVRVKQQPNKDKLLELHGKTAEQAVEGELGDTMTKRLDHIRKCLRSVLKQRQADSIGYYEFVLHPTNFNESVENAFHLSFLVNDGYVRLKVDEASCMPTVEPVSKEDRVRYQQNDRSQIDTTQHITQLSQDIWKTLVQLLDIREPLITQPTA